MTIGFESSGVTVFESSGEFRMCAVKDRVAVQDVTVTIVSQNQTASPNIGEITIHITHKPQSIRCCFHDP